MSEEKEIVIVTTETGREVRYSASGFAVDGQGHLGIGRLETFPDDERLLWVREPDALYAPGRWASVRLDGAIAGNDVAVRQLGIAKAALSRIGSGEDPSEAHKIADNALEDIWAEAQQ